jgi:hypothetical protein
MQEHGDPNPDCARESDQKSAGISLFFQVKTESCFRISAKKDHAYEVQSNSCQFEEIVRGNKCPA